MKIEKGRIIEEFSRDMYWTRIIITSDDETKKSNILVAASEEYLWDLYKLHGGSQLNEEHFSKWLDSVIEKWLALGEEIFKQSVHYDVYSVTHEGETNGLEFLINKVK